MPGEGGGRDGVGPAAAAGGPCPVAARLPSRSMRQDRRRGGCSGCKFGVRLGEAAKVNRMEWPALGDGGVFGATSKACGGRGELDKLETLRAAGRVGWKKV